MSTGATPRVLVVLTSNARRGAEIEGARLADELAARGFVAEAVALSATVAGGSLAVATLGERPLGLRTLRSLRRRAHAADVVIAHGSTALPACAIALAGTRVPFVYRSIGDPGQWVRGFAHRARTGVLMHRATSVVALWGDAAENIRQLYRLPARRVHVIANGRDASEFRPPDQEARRAARVNLGVGEHRVVAVVGALAEEKRVDLAIAAVAQLPDTHLIIAGDGPRRSELEGLAAVALAERCTFTGALDDVRSVLHAADVLLLTSRTEGMPGAVIEATMCGLGVVATDVGAMRWLVDQGMGAQLVPIDATPEAISRAVLEAPAPLAAAPSLPAVDLTTTTEKWATLLHDLVRDR